MASLRARFKRKNAFGDNQESKIDAEDKEHIYRDGFMSWIVSGREKPQVDFFEKIFLKSKTTISRVFMEIGRFGSDFRQRIARLREREILTPRLLGGMKTDQTRSEGLLEIGNAGDVDDGLSFQITYSKMEKATAAFAEMRLPRNCGTALTLDFLVRSDSTDSEVRGAVKSVEAIVKEVSGKLSV